ncbi:hypothetical protein ABPG75_004864 [Micractinium tetrahymenae]
MAGLTALTRLRLPGEHLAPLLGAHPEQLARLRELAVLVDTQPPRLPGGIAGLAQLSSLELQELQYRSHMGPQNPDLPSLQPLSALRQVVVSCRRDRRPAWAGALRAALGQGSSVRVGFTQGASTFDVDG